MRRLALLVVVLLLLVFTALFVAAGSGSAKTATYYSCTVRLSGGGVSYGVIFGSPSSTRILTGCRAFQKGSGSTLEFGIHKPLRWVIVSSYMNVGLNMIAMLIAPPMFDELIFSLANKRIFRDNGWTLIRRGS